MTMTENEKQLRKAFWKKMAAMFALGGACFVATSAFRIVYYDLPLAEYYHWVIGTISLGLIFASVPLMMIVAIPMGRRFAERSLTIPCGGSSSSRSYRNVRKAQRTAKVATRKGGRV